MTANALEQEMNTYFKQLSIAEKKSVLHMIKTFLSRDGEQQRISIEEYNKEIDETMAEVAQGQSHSHEEVTKIIL